MHMKAPFDCSRATQGHNLRIIMTSVRRRTFLLQVVDLAGVTVVTWKLKCFKIHPVNFLPHEVLFLRYNTLPVLPNNHGLSCIP